MFDVTVSGKAVADWLIYDVFDGASVQDRRLGTLAFILLVIGIIGLWKSEMRNG